MASLLHVTWTLHPQSPPRLWRHCGRCKQSRPFACSHKFRLNAQKKRIDAWLVYRCTACDRSWNCPVIERRTQKTIDPAVYAGLMANAPELVRRYAFDRDFLGRHADRIETGNDLAVIKSAAGRPPAAPVAAVISIAAEQASPIRLDRLISVELGLSRRTARQLQEAGLLTITPDTAATLKRSVRDGQQIVIDLIKLESRTGTMSAILQGLLGPGSAPSG